MALIESVAPAGRIGAIFCGVHNASAIVNRESRNGGADVVARRVTHSYLSQPIAMIISRNESPPTLGIICVGPRITNCTRLIRQQSRSEIIGPEAHPVAENQLSLSLSLSLSLCLSVTRRRLVEKEDLAVLISFGADTRGAN